MQIPNSCLEVLNKADGKALATYTEETGVNVVPVSSLLIKDSQIVLVNYFFNQTLKNIKINPEVSLAAWKGLFGYQFKATAKYETTGPVYDEVVEWIKSTLPDRMVKGVVILTPYKCFNVSAGPDAGREIFS